MATTGSPMGWSPGRRASLPAGRRRRRRAAAPDRCPGSVAMTVAGVGSVLPEKRSGPRPPVTTWLREDLAVGGDERRCRPLRRTARRQRRADGDTLGRQSRRLRQRPSPSRSTESVDEPLAAARWLTDVAVTVGRTIVGGGPSCPGRSPAAEPGGGDDGEGGDARRAIVAPGRPAAWRRRRLRWPRQGEEEEEEEGGGGGNTVVTVGLSSGLATKQPASAWSGTHNDFLRSRFRGRPACRRGEVLVEPVEHRRVRLGRGVLVVARTGVVEEGVVDAGERVQLVLSPAASSAASAASREAFTRSSSSA